MTLAEEGGNMNRRRLIALVLGTALACGAAVALMGDETFTVTSVEALTFETTAGMSRGSVVFLTSQITDLVITAYSLHILRTDEEGEDSRFLFAFENEGTEQNAVVAAALIDNILRSTKIGIVWDDVDEQGLRFVYRMDFHIDTGSL